MTSLAGRASTKCLLNVRRKLQHLSVHLTLGVTIASALVAYFSLLETTCSSTDPFEGAGELVITHGGSAKGTQTGTRFPAPMFVNAGSKLTENGTAEGSLVWVESLCDEVLDCASCPAVLDSSYNASVLRGKILIYDMKSGEDIFTCGLNRLSRTFGNTGLVGLAQASLEQTYLVYAPGGYPKMYRLGEFRDAKPRGGDVGIPFPHMDVNSAAFVEFLKKAVIGGGTAIRAVIKPTAPNPWRSVVCGCWKPLAILLMLGHVSVAERAISNLIGHIRMSGLRLDLAQLALGSETVAQSLMTLLHHDPYFASYFTALPWGVFVACVCSPFILSCSSTLLLAAYWCVIR